MWSLARPDCARNRAVLVAVAPFRGKEYSLLVSKGQYDFPNVITALHAGMGGARLL